METQATFSLIDPQNNKRLTQQSRAHPSLGKHEALSLVKQAFTLTRPSSWHLLTPHMGHLPTSYSFIVQHQDSLLFSQGLL